MTTEPLIVRLAREAWREVRAERMNGRARLRRIAEGNAPAPCPACGMDVFARCRKLHEATVCRPGLAQAAAETYRLCKSVRRTGLALGVSHFTVIRLLRSAGVKREPRHRVTADPDGILARLRAGQTVTSIAAERGCSTSAVSQAIKRARERSRRAKRESAG